MIVVKLTSAVTARAPVYLNLDHIISFADQSGGCAIKTTGGGSGSVIVAVTESAEAVLRRIAEAKAMEPRDGAERLSPD